MLIPESGAFFEGRKAGKEIAACLRGSCKPQVRIQILHGTTKAKEYNASNGWDVASFQTNGF